MELHVLLCGAALTGGAVLTAMRLEYMMRFGRNVNEGKVARTFLLFGTYCVGAIACMIVALSQMRIEGP